MTQVLLLSSRWNSILVSLFNDFLSTPIAPLTDVESCEINAALLNLVMKDQFAGLPEKTPVKFGKTTQFTKSKGTTSSKEDHKMISIHPDFVEAIRDPFGKNEFFKFVPRSIVIENLFAQSLKNSKCLIEELDKDDKT